MVVDESGSCSATKTISITPNGSDTIEGANSSAVIAMPYGYLGLESNGAGGWFITDQLALTSAPNGANIQAVVAETLVSGMSGATVTGPSIPANSIVLSVGARVVTAITGATSFEVGVSGNLAQFGSLIGLPAGTLNYGLIGRSSSRPPAPTSPPARSGSRSTISSPILQRHKGSPAMSYTPSGLNTKISSNIYTNGIGVVTAASLASVLYYVASLFLAYTPTAANNAGLSAIASTAYPQVTRLGYAAAGDSPPVVYTPSGSACSLNAGAGDGGSQVPSADGKCWLGQFQGVAFTKQFGAVCNGTTDDTPFITAAMSALSALGGGHDFTGQSGCKVAVSGNLTIPASVYLVGDVSSVGQAASNNYPAAPFTLLVSTSHSIVAGGNNAGILGLNVVRYGMSAPTTLRGFITENNAFAGTAISCNGYTDFTLDRIGVFGFNQAITSSCDRTTVTHVKGDDTNGLYLSGCNDLCVVDDVKFWAYVGSVYQVGPQYQNTTVTGAANNGSGLIRITVGSAPATPLVSGDIVTVGNVGGVPNAVGRFTVTVINSTTFDLQGSTWGGAFTSGGTLQLSGIRRIGTAFDFENIGGGPVATNLEDFGHDICVKFGGTTVDTSIVNGWCDNLVETLGDYDNVPQEIVQTGSAGNNRFQGFVTGPARILNMNASGYSPFTLLNTTVGGFGNLEGFASIFWVQTGVLRIVGSDVQVGGGICANNMIYMDASAAGLVISGSYLCGKTYYNSFATQCPLVSIDGLIGPCPWTPVIYGLTTAGTPTYTTQTGEYTINSAGLVNVWYDVAVSALGGMAGFIDIKTLPVAAGSGTAGGCNFERWAGYTASTNFNGAGAQISPGQNVITLSQTSATGFSTIQISATNLAAPMEFAGTCEYHE